MIVLLVALVGVFAAIGLVLFSLAASAALSMSDKEEW